MSKNRPQIPHPVLTPPGGLPSGADPVLDKPAAAVSPPSAPLASVPPPDRVAKVELLADRIVLTNPTLILDRYVELGGRDNRGQLIQKNRLTPARAEVMHGAIWIEELGLLIPLEAAVIRTF